MAAVAIPAAEVIIGGLARAGAWLWRAYRLYRAAQAQQQARATQEKEKIPPDLEKDTKDLIKFSEQIFEKKPPIQPIPWKQSDTEPACKKKALELVKTGFGLQS